MSFLKKMLGSGRSGDGVDPLAERFDAEWYQAVKRFEAISGYRGFAFNLRHPETGELMKPHEGVEPIFDEWKAIRSPWDRREMFYRCILATRGVENFDVWAVANVFTASRRPHTALEMLQGASLSEPGSEYYACHCGAYARALIPLNHPREALEWAQAAAAADPEDARLRVLLGDALRLAGRVEEAGAIYAGLMATASPSPADSPNPIADLFARLFARETGVVPSPFFAVDLAPQIEDPEQAEEFWRLGEVEFYDSPHFRMQHAYRLVQQGQVREAFAKLAALVMEMPWLREANLNLRQLFNHLDPAGDQLMPELRKQVEDAIREHGWTTDGMQLLEVSPDA